MFFDSKKGLFASILVVVFAIISVAVVGVFTTYIWSEFDDAIQDNDFISDGVKSDVSGLDRYLPFDEIFVAIFVVLMLGFFITASTLPVDKPVFFLFYGVSLVGVVMLSALFSNFWQFFISNPNLIVAAGEMSSADFILRYYPLITLFVGLLGGAIFYGRSKVGGGVSGEVFGGDEF